MHTNKIYLVIILKVSQPNSTIYLFLDLWKTFFDLECAASLNLFQEDAKFYIKIAPFNKL